MTYANLFPNNFRALVVDGVLDPVAWSTGAPGQAAALPFSTRLRSDAGAAATLEEFFRLCDAGGPNCAFAGAAAARFAALAADLRAQPHVVVNPATGQPVPFSYAISSPPPSAPCTTRFRGRRSQVSLPTSRRTPNPRRSVPLSTLHRELGLITKRGFPRYRNGPEGGTNVLCSDSDNPDWYAAWSAAAAASEAQFGYFGRLWTWISSPCVNWPSADADRYMGPFDAQTMNPVLWWETSSIPLPATRAR